MSLIHQLKMFARLLFRIDPFNNLTLTVGFGMLFSDAANRKGLDRPNHINKLHESKLNPTCNNQAVNLHLDEPSRSKLCVHY